MDAITKQFILPVQPTKPSSMPIVYPWESTNLYNLCLQLYELARNTGYLHSFEEFKEHFGEYLESEDIVIGTDEYTGEYIITPLPNVEQILRTNNKIMKHDVTIQPIPFQKVSNAAHGYTVTIG